MKNYEAPNVNIAKVESCWVYIILFGGFLIYINSIEIEVSFMYLLFYLSIYF